MIIRTKEELVKIRTAAKINTEALLCLKSLIEPGISSFEVDRKAEEFYRKNKVIPAFKNYHGYPATINFMLNDQVVHCIPNKQQIVREGDIVSIDTGCIYEGYYADQATSMGVGEMLEEDERLINIARLSVEEASRACTTDRTVGDIGYIQQTIIEAAGFSVVKIFVGHEIGKQLHDSLRIPGFGKAKSGPKLTENMLICIENQVNVGGDAVVIDKQDGWSSYTKDGSKSATFEHMVIVGKKKAQILTRF